MQVGVIFCSCAGQIEDKIAYEEILPFLKEKAAWIEKFELACSEETQKDIIELIRAKKPDGLIFLSCSPLNKGSIFIEIGKKGNINPYMINIVNMREQVSWVTKDKESSLNKTISLFNGALARLKKQKPLDEIEVSVSKDILIVGGGVAGLSAAVNLSKTGRKVYLVEKDSSLGGKAVRYEKLFPEMSCAPCFINPMVEEVINSANIHLRLNSELINLKGYYGNLYGTIRTRPSYVNVRKCIGCGACEEACPEGAIKVEQLKLPAIAKLYENKCLNFKGKKCDLCIQACPIPDTIDLNMKKILEKIKIGAILWSTGFKLMECSKFPNLGYGKYKDIYNSLEFEELLNSEGPSKGEIVTSSGNNPSTVAIIHCVGSLDENHESYCSKICCQYAFKFNRMIRQSLPETKILHFFKEIVLPGKKSEKLYLQARKDPFVELIRYNTIKDIQVSEEENSLYIEYINEKYAVDMIVLCPAILSGEYPDFKREGFFLNGSVKEGMSVEETIKDSLSICGTILSQLNQDTITKPSTIAKLEEKRCTKCGLCIMLCPYGAIELDGIRPTIIESLCEGCGICVSACPSKALELEGFTYEQIIAEIDGILNTGR